ncbi:MAG TPA: rod shape-determining protein RodA [Verrucomicrobiota bacterium]|nr:rod shape-determining protein RodA [Verrucomicrobiales bacterium]HRI12662.1 rod shape-determining protein RodA [Verrucomicrobiota bacterium]
MTWDRLPSTRRERAIEWPLWAAVAGLMLFGAAFIFSATGAVDSAEGLPWWRFRVLNQTLAYLLGIGAVVVLCLVDYARLARWALVAYWISVVLLVAVALFGVARLGAKRWIDFGPVQFQPSEFAKLAFLFALANFLARPPGELNSPLLFAKALGMALLPFVLILKQPDLGSSLVFVPVALVMMFVAGVPRKFLLRFIGGSVLLVVLILVDVMFAPPGWRFITLEDYQKHRLLVYFALDFAPRNASPAERLAARAEQEKKSYNVKQALISVGSGGFVGKGWRSGTQSALGYLPRAVAHNDFIFSVIAEETGFLGSVAVLTLYGVVLFSGIKIASQARDRLGRLLAVGVVALLFTHIFVNIGMNIRMVPVTGIPLPLLSAGGTSVLCSLIAVGILQNIYLHRRHY